MSDTAAHPAETVISGALTVQPGRPVLADIAIADGRISAVGEPGSLAGQRYVDARGMVLLPGGVDSHVHLHTQFGRWLTSDDFWTGTVPAAFGGTTTIINFAIPQPGETSLAAFARCRQEAGPNVAVDYTLHACVTRDRFDESLGQFAALREAGARSVKVFTTYRETIGLSLEQIDAVLRRAADHDLQVLVHAEANELIEAGIAACVGTGELSPHGHLVSRPAAAEEAAIRRVAELAAAAGSRVFFVHVSSAAGVEAVRSARGRSEGVHAETCVHYLCLDDTVYDRAEGELWVCSPPIRSRDDQEALWLALREGTLDQVSTDHNCFTREQKLAFHGDFRNVPNGLPGVELRLPAMIDCVARGRLTWAELAWLTAESPARLFGLWPRKGAIAVGADADLALISPTATTDLGKTHMATDYSPLVGMRGTGRVVQTWLRGEALLDGDEFRGSRGYGNWLVPGEGSTRPARPAWPPETS
ncbi:MAG: amidohydrolase family protein [Actinomycetota bacterium]|nr:amidohydrolase family protein [Actinomycetota bacterium]